MKYILAITLVVILVACSSGENHDQFAIGWRTNGITASIVRDDQSLGLGQYLILVHDLEPGEAGRLSKIIDISESWTVREIEVIDGKVRLETENSGIFEVSLENLGSEAETETEAWRADRLGARYFVESGGNSVQILGV